METHHVAVGQILDVLLVAPERDRAHATVRRIARGADEESIAVVARIALLSERASGLARLLCRTRWDTGDRMPTTDGVTAREEVIAASRGARTAGRPTGRPDTHAVVLARPVDAPIERASVAVVAPAVARALRRGRAVRRADHGGGGA